MSQQMHKRIKRHLIFLLLVSLPLGATVIPESQNFDNRVTQVKYNPKDVIKVRIKTGISTLIQLEQGETIQSQVGGIGVGDLAAWGVNVKGNNIFIKPIAKKPDTNLLVTTNKGRTYAFELTSSKWPHFIVKLAYEKPKTAADKRLDIPCYDGKVNFAYAKWGDAPLSPAYMWDDGRFTCLKFTNNAELPVAYQVASDGTESIINYHIEEDTMILHGIASEFRLRLGKQVLGLRSDDALSSGFNKKGTTIEAYRELIE
jgi:type IV secretion system protein VirB9